MSDEGKTAKIKDEPKEKMRQPSSTPLSKTKMRAKSSQPPKDPAKLTTISNALAKKKAEDEPSTGGGE